MTTFNTGNRLGSNAPKDLYDNAENLDNGINGPAKTWTDRLGVVRKSWNGIETDFQQFLADGSTIEFPTWAAANAAAGAGQVPQNRQVAVVGDTGTHVDPVTGQTVPNSGRFVMVAGGLQFRDGDVLSQKADKSVVDRRVADGVQLRVMFDRDYAWKLEGSNHRHVGGWRWDGTFAPVKAELPLSTTLADDPATPLIDRLSGSEPVWLLSEGAGKVYADNVRTGMRYLVGSGTDPLLLSSGYATWTDGSGRRWGRDLPSGAQEPLTPQRRVIMWGDSITAAQGTGMSSLIGAPVINRGAAGWASRDVAIRQGAQNVTLGAVGGQIPASGSVGVTVVSPSTGLTPYVKTSWVGDLVGVRGTLARDFSTNTWTFTRAASGSAVSCPPGSIFHAVEDEQYLDHVAVIGVGRNDVYLADFIPPLLDSIARMVDNLSPRVKQFVVTSVTNMQTEGPGNAKYDQILSVNQQLSTIYGARYFDLRRQFIVQGLDMAMENGWITEVTSADAAAVADDRPPPSLMSDNTHRNAAGVQVDQHLHAANIISKGYVL